MSSRDDPTWALGRGRDHATWPSGPPPGPPGSRPTAPAGRASTRLRLADRLGNYVVVRELARGGMGAVYEARHAETGGRYALKTVLTSDRETIERFQREARLLAQLDHPHLVRVHTADLDGPRPWFVQDLLEGGSLERRVKAGALPLDEALAITRKVGAALAHAHGRGVIHRDLKPANVLFDADGEPKLVDFGIARDVMTTSARLTASGEVLGSPGYMAPEQALGLREEDERTDVYALGALLYAMVAGKPPFTGTTAIEVIDAVAKVPARPLTMAAPGVPPALSAVVARAMSKDPAARPGDLAAFLGDLEQALAPPPAPPPAARLVPVLAALAVVSVLLATGVLVAMAPDRPPTPRTEAPAPPAATGAAPAPTAPAPAAPGAGSGWSATFVDGAAFELLWEDGAEGEPPSVFGFALRQVGAARARGGKLAEVVIAVDRVWVRVPTGAGALAHDTGRPGESSLPGRALAAWLDRTLVGAQATLRVDLETGAVDRVQGLPAPPERSDWPRDRAERQLWMLAHGVDDAIVAGHFENLLHLFPDRPPVEGRWRLPGTLVHLPFFAMKGEREFVLDGARVRQVMRDPKLAVPPGREVGMGAPEPLSVEGEATLDGGRVVRSLVEVRYRPTSQASIWTEVVRMTLTVR